MGLIAEIARLPKGIIFSTNAVVALRTVRARHCHSQKPPEVVPMKTFARQNSRRTRRAQTHRRGTTLVEFAMVLPVFFTFVFGIVEYGRLQLVSNMLKTACRNGARLGSTENVTTGDVTARVEEILAAALDTQDLTVIVKDASVFDTSGPYPASAADYDALSNAELDDVQPRQLFLVRASVAYNDIALLPFSVLDGVQLSGQALMRHE